MSQSIQHYVNVSVALEGTGTQPAGFGVPIFVYQHAVTGVRLNGPYTSLASMVSDGFVAGSAPYVWATAMLAQQPRVRSWYIGRLDAGDASIAAGMNAILAVNPGAWYCVNYGSRVAADVLAMAAWVESATYPKIYIAQSNDASILSGEGPSYNALFEGTVADGTYILTFTGFGLVSPVTVTTTRAAGTPATLSLVADAFRTQLTTQATGPGGDLFEVVEIASIGGTSPNVSFRIVDGLPTGTVVASGTAVASTADLTVTNTDADVASRLFDLQYARTALIYHATDSNYLDGAWTSRCLSADIDVQKLAWSYKQLAGVEGSELTDAQVTALRATNTNYFAEATMSSGNDTVAFTAQGWMGRGTSGRGRRIDVTISLDLLKARLEEAAANVQLRESHEVPYSDAGINRHAAASEGVFADLIAAGHLIRFVVPQGEDDEGRSTPFLDFPKFEDTTTTERVAGDLTSTRGIVYLRSTIEKVNIGVEARQ